MEMKLCLLKNELLCDTYTPETLAALRLIRYVSRHCVASLWCTQPLTRHLSEQLAQLQRDVASENERADSKLRQYAAAGPALERLAKEHARVLAEAKDREWALAKMAGTN